MHLKQTIKREFQIAFSKHTQPAWFRVLKYAALVGAFYFFGQTKLFWIGLAVTAVAALFVHFWYRHKTEGWTKSYGGWELRDDFERR